MGITHLPRKIRLKLYKHFCQQNGIPLPVDWMRKAQAEPKPRIRYRLSVRITPVGKVWQ